MLAAALAATVALAAPAAGASGAAAPRAVVPPPVGAPVSYQLGGAFTPRADAMVVVRDRTAPPADGHYSVCYVNAFQVQPGALGWWRRHQPDLLLRRRGRLVVDRDWNEVLLDISTAGKRARLGAIVGRWIDGCARDGFRAVEPDNLDSWTRSSRRLSAADARAFSAILISRAHARGLAIAQKNAAELLRDRPGFDFAVTEECEVYDECDAYTRAYGRSVIEIEYTTAAFARACAKRGGRISLTLRDRDVTPRGRERQCPR